MEARLCIEDCQDSMETTYLPSLFQKCGKFQFEFVQEMGIHGLTGTTGKRGIDQKGPPTFVMNARRTGHGD